MSRPSPLPEGIESVALGLAVGAGLAARGAFATAVRGEADPGLLAGPAAAALLLGTLSFGLFRRRRWAWGVALALCGLLTLLTLGAGAALAVELAQHGFGRPHGVTAGGEACLCALLPVALLIFGLPVVLLWRDRRRL